MRYLLDTDHLSVLQRQTGESYSNLSGRMAQYSPSEFAISIVTFHEQMLGSHAYINRARTLDDVVRGYGMMTRIVSDFKGLPLVSLRAIDTRVGRFFYKLYSKSSRFFCLPTTSRNPHGAAASADKSWPRSAKRAADRLTQLVTPEDTNDYSDNNRNELTATDHSYQTDEVHNYDATGNRTNYITDNHNRGL